MLLWRLVRRMLAILIRLFLINRIVTIGVVGLLFIGLVAAPIVASLLSGNQAAAAAPARTGATVRTAAASAVAPAPAVEAYVKGMTGFDAKMMLSSLSQEAIGQMQTRIGSVENYQQVLDEARRSGARYEDVSYIGAHPLRDGSQYFFYVIGRRGFAGPNVYEQVYYVFTVGPDGKITKIE